MVNIITDFDGSWSSENAGFAAVIEELGITIQYSSPDRYITKVKQENAVRVVEMGMKVIMINNGLPLSWWQKAAESAILARNLWPTQLSIKSKADYGASPLELITEGRMVLLSWMLYRYPHGTSRHTKVFHTKCRLLQLSFILKFVQYSY